MSDYLLELFEQYARPRNLLVEASRDSASSCSPRLVAGSLMIVVPGYKLGDEQLQPVLHQLLHLRRDMLSYTGGLVSGSFGPDPRQEKRISDYQMALTTGSHPVLRMLRESIDEALETARRERRDSFPSLRTPGPLGVERLLVRSR